MKSCMFFLTIIISSFSLAFGQGTNDLMVASKDSVYETVDVIPQFKGGRSAWVRFVQNSIDLHESVYAMDSTTYAEYGSLQTAILDFTVCEDGTICDIVVNNESKVIPEFSKAALKVMKKSPKWIPGQQDGKPVKVRFRQPITVNLME